MSKLSIHSLILVLSVFITFLWASSPGLSVYNLQLIAFFILVYFFNHWVQTRKFQGEQSELNKIINSTIYTVIVLLIVIATGGQTSYLFFLIYFLLFGLSLTLEPQITVILAITLGISFSFFNPVSGLNNFLPLFSLALITPLSLFFGRQYLKILHQKGEIKMLRLKEHEESTILKNEETDILLWLSLNFRHTLTTIIDLMSYVLEKPGLSLPQKQSLEKANKKAKGLLETGKILEDRITK